MLFSFCLSAQHTYRIGIIPSINLNKKLNDQLKINFKTESRSLYGRGLFEDGIQSYWEYRFTDVAVVLASKTGWGNKIAGGYQVRIWPDELHHRFIQQYTIVQKLNRFRMAHRIAADETLEADEGWQIRLRYRISGEFALNGESLDPQEWYLKINHEYLNIWQNDYDLEVRLIPIFGYYFSQFSKLELGTEYRIDSFISGNNTRHTLFGRITWFRSF